MKNKIMKSFLSFGVALFFVIVATLPASAAINSQINFQGKITNPDGTNIANGNYSIVFSLYNVATVGTAIWAETDTVTVTDGVFQVNLGTSCPFLTASACNSSTPIDFNNSAIFLGIKVAADPEMTPRVTFTASPYAFNSDKVGGFSVSQLIQNGTTQQATSNFNISGTGIAAVLQAGTFDTSAASALNIGTTNASSLIIAKAAVPTTVAGSLTVTQATTLSALLTVNNDLQFGQGANRNVSVNANTTANAAGYNLTLAAGAANGSTTGATGGTLALQGGAAAGTGNNNGGTISLDGGIATGAGTRGNVAIQGTGGATSVGGSLGVTGLITASGGLTLAANQNLTLTTGTSVITQGYTNPTTGNAINQTVTNSNTSATAATVSASNVTLVGATNANAAANTLVGYNLGTVTAVTNNAFYGLNVGTGFTDILRYSNTQLISGLGKLQNAAIDSTGLYTNLTGVGALTSGSIANGFSTISTGNTITTSSTLQGATVNATTGFTLNGASLNTANTLTNVAYLNQANTFSAAGAALTVTNNASVGGTLTVTGLLTVNGGETTTGAVSINATGTASTNIGNATGTFAVTSAALIVSTTGAVSGVTTLTASSTITGTTINGTVGLNTGAAAGTQRLDATGNLVNIGNITTTGASTLTTGGANGLTIKPTTDNATAFQVQTAAGVNFLAFSSSTNTLNVGPTTATAGTLNVATGAAVQAVTIGSTTTTSSTAIQGGATGAINIGSVGASTLSSAVKISNTTDPTGTQTVTIGSNANAANAVAIDAGNTGLLQIGNTTSAHNIQIGAGGAAAGTVQSVTIGSNSTTSASLVTLQSGNVTTVNNQAGVIIGGGFSSVDTNLVSLTLDSSATLNETANTCTATVNNGAMYYNSNVGSNAIRACVAGNWEDLVSTASAFFTFFGVVPDSGAVPGDIQSLSTANTTGPCKVAFATVTTVTVTACTAYSGGRKVTVVASTLTISTLTTTNIWAHICLSGTNSQPVVSAGAATETPNLNTVSFPSASTPIVCLADIKGSATTANNIAAIYDVRFFTTTTKEFAYASAALPLGVMVKPGGTGFNQVALPGTTLTGNMRGVVVASNGAAYVSGGPNVIIATAGLSSIKSSAATPLATGMTVQNSITVSGYAQATATANTTTYSNLGIPENSSIFTCTTTANCNGSFLTSLSIK